MDDRRLPAWDRGVTLCPPSDGAEGGGEAPAMGSEKVGEEAWPPKRTALTSFAASFSKRFSSVETALKASSTSEPISIQIGASCSACSAPAIAALRRRPRLCVASATSESICMSSEPLSTVPGGKRHARTRRFSTPFCLLPKKSSKPPAAAQSSPTAVQQSLSVAVAS